jgi:hypothetical protein
MQILKNNIKNLFYKDIGALVPYKTPLRRQMNSCKTRSLIYYNGTVDYTRVCGDLKLIKMKVKKNWNETTLTFPDFH